VLIDHIIAYITIYFKNGTNTGILG